MAPHAEYSVTKKTLVACVDRMFYSPGATGRDFPLTSRSLAICHYNDGIIRPQVLGITVIMASLT